MAQSSGSFQGGVHNNYQRIRVDWSSTQNIERNSSTIVANMYLDCTGDLYIGSRTNNHTVIDGTSIQWNSPAVSQSSSFSILLATVSKEIFHDNYGNKTFSMSVSFNIDATLGGTRYYFINASSGDIELPNIPRASSIVVNNADIGAGTTITINKNVNSFTTDLYWRVQGDSNWNYIGNTSQSSYGWTVPTSLYSRIPNSRTITCEFLARTLSGGTAIGDKTTTATFTATGNPIINGCTLVSTDSTTVNLVGSNRMIRYISTVKATVNASTAHNDGSTISSIKVNGSTATNGVVSFANASTYSYEVVVTDSRGYSSKNTYTITWTDYIPLTLNATVTRNQPTDGKINININGNYFNSSFRKSDDTYVNNTLSVQYRTRLSGGTWTSWKNLTFVKSGNSYSVSYQESGYDYTKQYEMQIWAGDQVSSQTMTGINISKGKPTFSWGEDFFNVNGTLKINDIAILTNLYPVGSIYMSVNNVNPSTYFGGTWVAWGSGRVPVGVNTNDSNFNTVEKTGGASTVTLTEAQMPSHYHSGTTAGNGDHAHQIGADDDGGGGSTYSTVHKGGTSGSGRQEWTTTNGWHDHSFNTDWRGSSEAHNNLQPYITCYMWKRTA